MSSVRQKMTAVNKAAMKEEEARRKAEENILNEEALSKRFAALKEFSQPLGPSKKKDSVTVGRCPRPRQTGRTKHPP